MATTLYLRANIASTSLGSGHIAKSTGLADTWHSAQTLETSAGTGGNSAATLSTVSGPTTGIEFEISDYLYHWLSPPLAAAATISGTISFKICGYESNAKANAKFAVLVQKVSAQDFAFSTIADSGDDAEMDNALADQTWTASPTSTAMAKGDRIRIVPYIDDSSTMATGYSCYLRWNGTDAATGDSYVQFTEDLSFMTFSGSQYLYPTNVASDVSTADVDYKIWTSRGT